MNSFNEDNQDNEKELEEKLVGLGFSIRPDKAFAERLLAALPEITAEATHRSIGQSQGTREMSPWLRALFLAPLAIALLIFVSVGKTNSIDPISDILALEVEASEIDQNLDFDYESLSADAEMEMDFVELDSYDESSFTN